ncbi:hypothetical protein LZ30DRAFT_447321 [Colletotrichum cereale]|nr:hypothetical protein LZ30DRAFT_447321 [Colletotrichum cereale]
MTNISSGWRGTAQHSTAQHSTAQHSTSIRPSGSTSEASPIRPFAPASLATIPPPTSEVSQEGGGKAGRASNREPQLIWRRTLVEVSPVPCCGRRSVSHPVSCVCCMSWEALTCLQDFPN